MIRTQVFLTEEQARDIKLRAKREKKREAEVIRELLSKGLHASRSASGETVPIIPLPGISLSSFPSELIAD